MSSEISFGTDKDTPIEGLTSIVVYLGSMQVRLRVPPTHHLRQVEEDVDTLLGYLRGMAVGQSCTLPKAGSTLLKSETDFPITSYYQSLLDLQRYLEKLCLNLDKLKSCWMISLSPSLCADLFHRNKHALKNAGFLNEVKLSVNYARTVIAVLWLSKLLFVIY